MRAMGNPIKTNDALTMYRARMQEIVHRLDVVGSLLTGRTNLLYLPPTVECVYLQFRHVLELIATASLAVNQDADSELRKEGRRKWHAGDILEAVEIVNPNFYYPRPVRLVERNDGQRVVGEDGYRGEWLDFQGDYLTREKFTTLYSASSRFLHTPNPFDRRAPNRDRKTDSNQMKQAEKWRMRIVELLTHHQFRPASEPDTKLFVCHTVGPNAEFQVTEWQQLP